KRPPRRPRAASARDPLFNSSVQKAIAMLESFGGERRERSLAELAAGTRMTVSSAQRCTHTLVRLGLLKRDARARRWVLTPRVLSLAASYLSGHALLEQATTHPIALNPGRARRATSGRIRSAIAATSPSPRRCWERTGSRSPPSTSPLRRAAGRWRSYDRSSRRCCCRPRGRPRRGTCRGRNAHEPLLRGTACSSSAAH